MKNMKKVKLVCPDCGEIGLYEELEDSDFENGDFTDECDACGYGLQVDQICMAHGSLCDLVPSFACPGCPYAAG